MGSQDELKERLQKVELQLKRAVERRKAMRKELASLAREWTLWHIPETAVCAEIGVDRGKFSRRILDEAKPAKLDLIDPWEAYKDPAYADSRYGGFVNLAEGEREMDRRYAAVVEAFSHEIDAGTVVVRRRYSTEAAVNYPDDYFDWVYIDGNHRYEYVKADLEAYLPKMKVSGYIVGDDYGVNGWWENGVKRAVDEFVEKRGLKVHFRHTQFLIPV